MWGVLVWLFLWLVWCRWGKRAAHNRAQIVYYIAENLELRRSEFAGRIALMTGRDEDNCKKEVDLAIQRLFYWGAYADKYGGTVQVGGAVRILVLWHKLACVVWGYGWLCRYLVYALVVPFEEFSTIVYSALGDDLVWVHSSYQWTSWCCGYGMSWWISFAGLCLSVCSSCRQGQHHHCYPQWDSTTLSNWSLSGIHMCCYSNGTVVMVIACCRFLIHLIFQEVWSTSWLALVITLPSTSLNIKMWMPCGRWTKLSECCLPKTLTLDLSMYKRYHARNI